MQDKQFGTTYGSWHGSTHRSKGRKKHLEEQHKQSGQSINANGLMRKMTASLYNIDSVMFGKQELLEIHSKLASMWKWKNMMAQQTNLRRCHQS